MASLSDDPLFVIISYVFGFVTITIAAKYDFISSVWSDVRKTRIYGKCILIIALVSCVFLLRYIVVQAKGPDPDYKEACAGFVALLVSFLNLFRSFMGLWQLYCFSHWAQTARTRLKTLLDDGEDSEFFVEGDVESVDEMIINQSIIENKIFTGDVKLFGININLYFLGKDKTPPQNRDSWKTRLKDAPWMERFKDFLFFPIFFSVILIFTGTESFLRVPTAWAYLGEPEEQYIQWATVFLACHPSFIKKSGRKRQNEETTSGRLLERFRRQVLIYCSLHITDIIENLWDMRK